ncbi:phage head-tail connector protein [Enterococcus cecorum]|nr:phage head-tail connector protein [Enterococcus cecorum]
MEQQQRNDILNLVKAILGYRTNVRDELLFRVIDSVVDELEKVKGVPFDFENNEIVMYVADMTVFRYQNLGGGAIPRNLDYRLKNLIVKYRKVGEVDV